MQTPIQINFSGASMCHLLKDGDILTCEQIPFDELKKRDVIFFRIPKSDAKAVHRIIQIDYEKRHVKTKGDGALIPDPFHLRESEILGKIVSYTRGGTSVALTPGLLYLSYLYSKVMHPYRKLKNIVKTQTIFRG